MKKRSWQSETEGFLFFPEGIYFGYVCARMHTLLWSLYLRFDDLEDKKNVHEDLTVLQTLL